MSDSYILPSKVNAYLKRLLLEYKRNGKTDIAEVITHSRIAVDIGAAYDNWNNGTTSHDVIFYLPDEQIGRRSRDGEKAICDQLLKDLNDYASRVITHPLAAG